MTPERFGELLQRPAQLSLQNATELEELVGRYPWSGPLRRLRYEKALLDGDAEEISLWRTRAEPYLERADRGGRAQRLQRADPTKADQHFGFAATQATPAEPNIADNDTATETSQQPYAYGLTPADYGRRPNFTELLAGAVAISGESIETVDWYLRRHGNLMTYGRPDPTPKESLDSYRTWKARRGTTSWKDLLDLSSSKAPRSTSRKPKPKRTPEPAPLVVSETLADLLATQGHTDKAVRMYEQLALRYPLRHATFTARILELQQLLA